MASQALKTNRSSPWSNHPMKARRGPASAERQPASQLTTGRPAQSSSSLSNEPVSKAEMRTNLTSWRTRRGNHCAGC